jgi:hypothetical protein
MYSQVSKPAGLHYLPHYRSGKEANVFKCHEGDDKLVSDPHESIEEFETRVREVTDHRLLVICAEYIEPE